VSRRPPAPALAALLAISAAVSLLPAAAETAARPGSTLSDCETCPQMIVVPAGRFDMGSADGESGRPETPVHEVRIRRAFALGRTEVTFAQFRRFVEATGYSVAPGCRVQEREPGPRGRIEWKDDPTASWRDPRTLAAPADAHPVVCVGRVDALAYADWLSRITGRRYRLPSEAEWEYAARAGASGIYPWGSNSDLGCPHANLYDRSSRAKLDFGWGFADCDDGFPEAAPVGSLRPNAFGLHDMIGNVWEWTQDCYVETYERTPRDGSAMLPQGECKLWSVRGGGWSTRPSRQRLTFRGRDPNDAKYSYFGFRVARDL
jgi:formylglycine-generating enzyme required for sulfatase activity